MDNGNRIFSCEHFSERDFSEMDLSGRVFKSCSFTDVTFRNANLRGCEFFNCKHFDNVSFEGADMTGCTIRQCVIEKADFSCADMRNSHLLNLDVSGSSLYAVKFNGSHINGLTVHKCNMNLASFEDTEIDGIDYSPVRKIPFMRGIRLFRAGALQSNTIFISGNQHLEFYDYCMYERRKDKFFRNVNKTGWPLRPFAIIFLFLFGLLTDFGQSFGRWSVCTLAIIAVYAVLPVIRCEVNLYEAILSSLLGFFGFGELPGGYDFFYVSESIVGYFMLGALISLLTSKLSIN